MASMLYQYEAPPMPQKWTAEERLFYTKLMDVLDDIFQRFGNTDNALEEYKKALAETVGAIETKTAENSQAIDDIIGGDTPVVTKTVTFNCSSSGTYRSNKGNWANYDILQGYERDTGVNYGCMWFGSLSSLNGKTITEAKLTVSRQSGYNPNKTVQSALGTCTNSGRSGTVDASDTSHFTRYNKIGSVAPGKTATFTIPNAAVEQLVAGTRQGLVLFLETSPTYYSTYYYSPNYAAFWGSNQNNKPQLTVTYTE